MRSYLSVQAKQFMQFPKIKAFGWGEIACFSNQHNKYYLISKAKRPTSLKAQLMKPIQKQVNRHQKTGNKHFIPTHI
jgi:hypothetical protein